MNSADLAKLQDIASELSDMATRLTDQGQAQKLALAHATICELSEAVASAIVRRFSRPRELGEEYSSDDQKQAIRTYEAYLRTYLGSEIA